MGGVTMDEDYEILPHQILADLKSEVEALKKKLTQPDAKAQELILEIESLKDSIHDLTTIFQKALEDMKQEGDAAQLMKGLTTKIEAVISQNETIARGMIAISDKVEDFVSKQNTMPSQMGSSRVMSAMAPPNMNRPGQILGVQHTMGMPAMGDRVAPQPMMEMPMMPGAQGSSGSDDFDLPPPPPGMSMGKRKGLFK